MPCSATEEPGCIRSLSGCSVARRTCARQYQEGLLTLNVHRPRCPEVTVALPELFSDRFGYLNGTLPYSSARSGASTVTDLIGHSLHRLSRFRGPALAWLTNHSGRVFSPGRRVLRRRQIPAFGIPAFMHRVQRVDGFRLFPARCRTGTGARASYPPPCSRRILTGRFPDARHALYHRVAEEPCRTQVDGLRCLSGICNGSMQLSSGHRRPVRMHRLALSLLAMTARSQHPSLRREMAGARSPRRLSPYAAPTS